MPPRGRAVNDSLTPENLATLAAALAEGRRATVYLREPNPSLGLPDGTSAKVVSIDGTTVTISPKGVNDELPYEAEELRITRNAATSAAPAKRVPAKKVATPPSRTAEPTSAAESVRAVNKAAPVATKAASVENKAAPVRDTAVQPKNQAARRAKKAPSGVSVTI
ncbi:putative uncharacterized protein (fragment), partial [Rhodococcus sp. AW25M09]